jgi:hypothetical protein
VVQKFQALDNNRCGESAAPDYDVCTVPMRIATMLGFSANGVLV